MKDKHFVNEAIKARQLRVIDATGTNLGIISREDALQHAEDAGLDLVQIGQHEDLVIAKIMDFGKFLYEKKKQENIAKKNQKVIQIKEIKLRPVIDQQDYAVKLKKAVDFLKEGKRVKCTLQFRRGRELSMMDVNGRAMFDRIQGDLEALNLGALVEEKEQRGKILWSKIYYIKEK